MTTHLIYTTQTGAEVRVEMTDAQASGISDALVEYARVGGILAAEIGDPASRIWFNPRQWSAWRFQQSQSSRVNVAHRAR